MLKKIVIIIFILFSFTLMFATRESLSFTQSEGDKVVGPQNNIMPTSSITVEVWYYALANSGNDPYRTIVSTGYAYNNANGWLLRLPRTSQNNIPHVRLRTSSGINYIDANSGNNNEWHHLAFTYDGSYLRLYMDGTLQDSVAQTGNILYDTNDHLNVGQMANTINEPWNGYIDEVRIWNTALSGSTINDWKDKEVDNTHPNYSNLFIYYKFNEGTGQTVNDSSGNGYDAVLGDDSTVETDDPAWYGDSPLPIVLSQFYAQLYQNYFAEINWRTESEQNLLGYNIYRNLEDLFAGSIKINSSIIEATNTSSTMYYSFVDKNVNNNTKYYYWLEGIEFAGNSKIFGPVTVTINYDEENGSPYSELKTGIQKIYPNPFNPQTTISYLLDKSSNVVLKIYNTKGELIKSYNEGFKNKNVKYYISWDGTDNQNKKVTSGIYIFKLLSQNKTISLSKAILIK